MLEYDILCRWYVHVSSLKHRINNDNTMKYHLIKKKRDNMKNKSYKSGISIRCDERMGNMIDELQEKLFLNTTSVMRLALANLYEKEIGRLSNNNEGD